MKTTIGIILGVILGAIIIVAVLVFIFSQVLPANRGSSPGGVSTPPPSSITITQITPTGVSPATSLPANVSPPVASPPGANADVNFDLNIISVSGSGFTRTVTGQITNTGKTDVHNAWGKVEVSANGARIQVNGQDYLKVDLGTIKAGQTATAQITMNFSPFDAPKILQNGATFNLTIYSDEKTQTLTYDYHP